MLGLCGYDSDGSTDNAQHEAAAPPQPAGSRTCGSPEQGASDAQRPPCTADTAELRGAVPLPADDSSTAGLPAKRLRAAGRKRARGAAVQHLPPPPSDLFDMPNTDGTAVAQGKRMRHEPHRVGVWSGLVYLEVDVPGGLSSLRDVRGAAPTGLGSAGCAAGWGEVPSLHVSLSRQLYMNQGDIEAVARGVEGAVSRFPPFSAEFTQSRVLLNEEGTTAFAVVVSDSDLLLDLIAACSRVLKSLGFPGYFRDPVPHFTVATRLLGSEVPAHQQQAPCLLSAPLPLQFSAVCFKAGNRFFKFELE